MKRISRFLIVLILITGALLLRACAKPQPSEITQSVMKRIAAGDTVQMERTVRFEDRIG